MRQHSSNSRHREPRARAGNPGGASVRKTADGPEPDPMPWLFPVPVRASRFLAGDAAFARFNVEVAQDHIASFSFATSKPADVLFYDLQTQLESHTAGRHGSGRSGVYRGHYLKGVGRTPAAANWNNRDDLYHASGHLSVGSAIRERLITAVLEARGLGAAVVPCRAVLLAPLTPAEARAVRRDETSSRARFTPADGQMMALTVKPADFARMSNFVFALDHFTGTPQQLGDLFLALERFLHPPGARRGLEGAPRDIARALDAAFRRGWENFMAYARMGLFWLYLSSNFTLDGRFLDLETPLFFGAPFVGRAVGKRAGGPFRDLLGFEEFGFVRHWRLFLAWLLSRLRLLLAPEAVAGREARLFLRTLHREVAVRFSGRHLLYDDGALARLAADNLAQALALGRRDRSRLSALARYAFEWLVYSAKKPVPDMAWRPLKFAPAPATPLPRRFEAAGFIEQAPSADGDAYAAAINQLGSLRDPRELLRALARCGQADLFERPGTGQSIRGDRLLFGVTGTKTNSKHKE